MSTYVKNFMKYRFLLVELVKKNIKLKYRRSYLGLVWTLIEPLLTMIVLTIVFGTLFGNKDKTFPVYILSGRLLYTFFANGTKTAMTAIRANSGMIKKVYVPKYIYPLANVVSDFVIFLISLIVLFAVAVILQVKPTVYLVTLIVPLIILFVMTFAVGIILATMAVFFRDLEYLWSVALMIVMYTSAIFYYPDKLIDAGYGWILQGNPLYSVIVNFRNAIFGQPFDMVALGMSVGFSIIALIVGLIMFFKQQDKFILHL